VHTFVITARPIYGQPLAPCLEREEVEESVILTSYPGILHVTLRPGASAQVADEIAACLRSLPGEPLTVKVQRVEDLPEPLG